MRLGRVFSSPRPSPKERVTLLEWFCFIVYGFFEHRFSRIVLIFSDFIPLYEGYLKGGVDFFCDLGVYFLTPVLSEGESDVA